MVIQAITSVIEVPKQIRNRPIFFMGVGLYQTERAAFREQTACAWKSVRATTLNIDFDESGWMAPVLWSKNASRVVTTTVVFCARPSELAQSECSEEE